MSVSQLPLVSIISEYNEIQEKLAHTTDTQALITLGKQLKRISPQFILAQEILHAYHTIEENHALLNETQDDELIHAFKDEILALETRIQEKEAALLHYLTPADERDDSDIYLEIRAGAGGDESSLFAGELLRTYTILCQELGMSSTIVDFSSGTVGGYKEVVVEIKGGDGAFQWFKYEGGVHRVQRVPATEKQGRVHTSTVSVAIMPIIEEQNNFKIPADEIETIITTSQGAGGQSVNTTYSAVAMVHKPTGIRAQCQDERSQTQNRIKCLQILTSRVFDHFETIRKEEEARERKEQVGTADRSEKIRTYNFPQDRLTDHRYGENFNQLPDIMNGGIKRVIEKIKEIEAKRAIEQLSDE